MAAKTVTVTDSSVYVQGLEIARKDIADYLRDVPEDQQPIALIQAMLPAVISNIE